MNSSVDLGINAKVEFRIYETKTPFVQIGIRLIRRVIMMKCLRSTMKLLVLRHMMVPKVAVE